MPTVLVKGFLTCDTVVQGHCYRNMYHLRRVGSPRSITDSSCHPEQATYQLLFGLNSPAAKRV